MGPVEISDCTYNRLSWNGWLIAPITLRRNVIYVSKQVHGPTIIFNVGKKCPVLISLTETLHTVLSPSPQHIPKTYKPTANWLGSPGRQKPDKSICGEGGWQSWLVEGKVAVTASFQEGDGDSCLWYSCPCAVPSNTVSWLVYVGNRIQPRFQGWA